MTADPFGAVHARCVRCGALSWPLDVVCLDHERALVQFASPCEHADAQVRIVSICALGYLLDAMHHDRSAGGAR